MTDKNPLLTRRIVRQLVRQQKGTDNAALRYLRNLVDTPPTEQTMYRVLGRVGGNVLQDADAEDGSPVFSVLVWLGRLGFWAFKSELAMVRTTNVQWAASLRKGKLIDLTAQGIKIGGDCVFLWRV